MTTVIHGFCEDRFLPLKDAFVANFDAGLELGASLAMTHHGRPVVDLWAGWADGARTRAWERDTIVVLRSLTKSATILCLLMLIDRGLVDLDATVATYWPEFAAGGKDRVTVREAMSHQAGVPGYVPPVSVESLHDWEATVGNLAAQSHWFGGEPVLCYHSFTYGFLLGEIIRRVDGRKPAQFFREEFAGPAGIDLQIGLGSQAERARTAQVWSLHPVAPVPFGNPVLDRIYGNPPPGDTDSWDFQRLEHPGGNGYGNGRSIARLGAIFAGGGVLDGVRYLSQAIVDEASREQVFGEDPAFGPLHMGLGFGLDGVVFPAPTPTCFHWGGAGGSLICMDQTSGVSFGYAMNNFIMGGDTANQSRFQQTWRALGEVIAGL